MFICENQVYLQASSKVAQIRSSPAISEMCFQDLTKLGSVQKHVGNWEKIVDFLVETFMAGAEQINAQLQSHTRIALVISELDKSD